MNKKEKQFQEICYEALSNNEIKDSLCNAITEYYETNGTKEVAVVFLPIKKEVLHGGTFGMEYYIVTKKHNESLWKGIPDFLRKRVESNPNSRYIIFMSWDSIFCSFILYKSEQVKNN